jgi:hypothetical protein
VEQRKRARDKFAEKGRNGLQPLNTRHETGIGATFAAGQRIEHRRDAQGKPTQQEAGRLARLSLNPRPGQRQHAK